jgi:hypothetical protein
LNTFSNNLATRGLRQMDRAFWCLHDHVSTFAILGLPTLAVSVIFAGVIAFALHTWNFDGFTAYVLWSFVVPVSALTILTFLPLPCAVFAWFQARNETKTAGECFHWCRNRAGRLFSVFAWLVFSYSWWFVLLGIPMLVLWPRTCQAPMVAMFEDKRGIFRRSRQLMREDSAIHVLAGLFFLVTLVLGSLIPLPRLILFSKLFEGEWTRTIEEMLWAFELVAAVILLCIVAISWSVSLTLFYHNLRQYREGEVIQSKVSLLQEKYMKNEATL